MRGIRGEFYGIRGGYEVDMREIRSGYARAERNDNLRCKRYHTRAVVLTPEVWASVVSTSGVSM